MRRVRASLWPRSTTLWSNRSLLVIIFIIGWERRKVVCIRWLVLVWCGVLHVSFRPLVTVVSVRW
jgi:hypothetical protein